MTEQELQEIEARAEAATPGPWRAEVTEPACGDGWGDGISILWGEPLADDDITPRKWQEAKVVGSCGCCNSPWIEHADAQFIAHAREDIPELVAEVRRLREGLEFYAEKANWRTTSEGFAAQYDLESPAAVKDGGIRARLALMSQLDAPNG